MAFSKLRGSCIAAGLLSTFALANIANAEDLPPSPESPNVSFSVQQSVDPANTGDYARNLYLAYIKGPDDAQNQLTEYGLAQLAMQTKLRSAIEPAGIVGLDPETDDLSLFPFIYWPLTENTPMPSETALKKIREYTAQQGHIIIDLVGSSNIQSSTILPEILNAVHVRPVEVVKPGHALSQSFYVLNDLPGTQRSIALAERPQDVHQNYPSSFIIGDSDWSGAWSGITTGPDVTEDALRSGINMVFYVIMGTYKNDDIHAASLAQKREFIEEARRREAEAASTPPPALE